MNYAATYEFFKGSTRAMSTLKVLESSSRGTTPEFVVWEMLLEVGFDVDEPALDIQKGQKALIRGVFLTWWKWEGEGEQWNGDLGEQGLRGWKIVKESDYMIRVRK